MIRSVLRLPFLSAALALSLIALAPQLGCTTGVRPADFHAHIHILASDELGGRGVGEQGIDLAAGYIAGQLESLGVEPGGENGTYFQRLTIPTGSELMENYEFAITGVDVKPKRGEDFIPFSFSSPDEFDGDVVFAGYGIVNKDKNWDDYASIDAKGKVVLMLRREPPSWADNDGPTPHASFRNKIYAAKEHGAAAVLVVNRFEEDEKDDDLMRFDRRDGGSYPLPAFHIKQSLAEAILSAGGDYALGTLQTKLDGGDVASSELRGIHLKGKAGIKQTTALARNVIGVIKGQGPLADEYVVIGGHYDHLGTTVPTMGRSGSTEPQIHNGADDNASGAAGVIETARVLMQSRPLKRSVIVMTFTGEEMGLHGSKYFVEHPTVPLDHIVAMLNMDMIGRLDAKSTIQVFGTKAAEEFEPMITRVCKNANMTLRASESALGPSDHTSFYQKKVPSIHFFTGLHADYHRPGDDVEKVNNEGGARVTDLVVATAREIIDAPRRPTYHEVTARAQIDRGPGRARVVMGVMPGYVDEGKDQGMPIDGVTEGGPAEKAGLKGGDRILKIGTTDVNNVYDYMGALRNNKPGDEVDVVINRDGAEQTVKVTLTSR